MTYQKLSHVLKTMADPSRLEILDLLSCGELCGCDLLEHFSFSQPTLSHHMKSLVESNLVFFRKEGTKTMYKLNHKRITEVTGLLAMIGEDRSPCVCDRIEKGDC